MRLVSHPAPGLKPHSFLDGLPRAEARCYSEKRVEAVCCSEKRVEAVCYSEKRVEAVCYSERRSLGSKPVSSEPLRALALASMSTRVA